MKIFYQKTYDFSKNNLNMGYYSKLNNIINCYVIGPSTYPSRITFLIFINIIISIFWLLDSQSNVGETILNQKYILWIVLPLLLLYINNFIGVHRLLNWTVTPIIILYFSVFIIAELLSPWRFAFTSQITINIFYSICIFILPIILWIITFLQIYNWMLSINNWEAQKFLTNAVQKNIIQGFYLFAISEIMLFFGFFWAFFHFAWSPSIELGGVWPPIFLNTVNPFGLPVLNTILLMSSGFLLSLGLKANNLGDLGKAKLFTYMSILLGICFLAVQRLEFLYSGFLPSQSIFGSTFFGLTSLHGFHVVLGLIGLFLFLIQLENSYSIKQSKVSKYISTFNQPLSLLIFSGIFKDQTLGAFLAAFYWHLVDAIWVFLVIVLYFNFPLIILIELILALGFLLVLDAIVIYALNANVTVRYP